MKITNDELGKKAYAKVKDMIISKKLAPGQKIVQEKLADELGISRTPLRSALQMLESESLIESIPRKGVIVREFSNEEIVEVYDCRIALESTAVGLFTKRATNNDLQKLASFFSGFELGKEIDEKEYQIKDSQFHNFIIKNCGNRFLYNLFNKGNLLVCIDLIGLVRPAHETLPEHLGIISAIKNRNVNLAMDLITDHLNKSKNLLI